MANTLKFGNGEWYGKKDTILAYNDENNNYKPLPFDFSRGSSATVVNKDGLIEEVGSGQARIDYKDNTKGALLLEPERRNLVKSSGDISTQSTYWLSNQGGTSVQNATTAPDGSNTASQINTFGQQYGGITQGSISVSNTEYTYSIYLKAKNGTPNIRLIFFDGATFHSSDFTISSEWKRYDYKFTPVSGSFQIYITCPYLETSFYAWGIQAEQGSYATSYIPTSGEANGVTRLADSCNNGGNEQVINSTEGVLYAEISALESGGVNRYISLSDNTTSNRIQLILSGSNANRISVNGTGLTSIDYDSYNQTDMNKVAFKYSSSGIKLFVNGIEVGSNNDDATWPSGTLTTLDFALWNQSSVPFYGNVKDIKLYNTALTDQELIALTTI
jgi:hypothetical protein